MTRYINADEAVNALKRWFKFPDYNKGEKNIIACAITMLEEAPTADVEERKKGEWIDYSEDGYVECPFCHCATNCDDNKEKLHFCFWCGADMRGEQE